jgi:hypothetical protein
LSEVDGERGRRVIADDDVESLAGASWRDPAMLVELEADALVP